jgi:putative transposase
VSQQLAYKCQWYGSQRIEVPARNTSLECPACGHVSRDNRPSRAVFLCAACGHEDHPDRNAAINIRERGIKLALAGGQPVTGLKVLRTWRQPTQEAVA